MIGARALLAVVCCAALLTGCAGVNRSDAPSLDVRDGRDSGAAGISCWSIAPGASASPTTMPSASPLPKDFVAVSAQRCVLGTVVEPGDGEWQVRNEQEATTGLDTSVNGLRRQSSPTGRAVACPDIGVVPIDLTLTDAQGRKIRPAIPHDSCNLPYQSVVRAIEALPWKTVKQTKINQIRSQLEIDSGCSGSVKPMVALAGTEGFKKGSSTPLFGGKPPTSLKLCRYKLDPKDRLALTESEAYAVGRLESAGTLTGTSLSRFIAAFDAAAGATARCDKPQPPFAVLFPQEGNGRWLSVELGGCYRAVDDENHLRQLDAATVAPLKP